MRFAVLTFLTIAGAAHADFGTGVFPGQSCGGPFAPAGQVQNGQTELSDLNNDMAARERRLDQLRAKEDRLDEYISRGKRDMAEVITEKGFLAIREHRERNNDYASYRLQCGGRGPVVNETTDPELFSTAPRALAGEDGGAQYPPPDAFCVTNPATGQRENLWEKFVDDGGRVSDRLCDFRIAGVTKPANSLQRKRCRAGLHEYYDRMEEKLELREQIAELDDQVRTLGRRLERVRDDITEGRYCETCYLQRRGYANSGMGNSMMQNGSILNALSPFFQRQQPVMYGPQSAYGGPGFPGQPYPAPVPGYYGVMPGPQPGLGSYGAVPGSVGPGAFGCQGSSPFGAPVSPVFGGLSPFNNPYANPSMMPQFNQGAGPWGYPQYANGAPAFQSAYPFPTNPYNRPIQYSPYPSYPAYPTYNAYVPGYPTATGNYMTQVGLMNTQLLQISNGGYYGAGGAPITAPYLYNTGANIGTTRANPPVYLPYVH